MNIIEAIKSGKRFRRKGFDYYYEPNIFDRFYCHDEIIADDWEVEERKMTITKSQLESACHNAADNTLLSIGPVEFVSFIIELQKELGL